MLATHILKLTGSYEQVSYAIQDTPDMIQQHYGRFLPQDKAALAAKILRKRHKVRAGTLCRVGLFDVLPLAQSCGASTLNHNDPQQVLILSGARVS